VTLSELPLVVRFFMELLSPRKRCKTPLWNAVADGLGSLPTILPTVPVPCCNSNEPDLFGDSTAGWNTYDGYFPFEEGGLNTPANDRTELTGFALKQDSLNSTRELQMPLVFPSRSTCTLCESHLKHTQMTADMLVGRTLTYQRAPQKKRRARLPLIEIKILASQRTSNLKERIPVRGSTTNEFCTVFRLRDVCDPCKYDIENYELPRIAAAYRLTTPLLMEICGAKPKGFAADMIEQLDNEAWMDCLQEQGISIRIPPKLECTKQKYTISDVHALFHIDSLVDLVVAFVNPLYTIDIENLFTPLPHFVAQERTSCYMYHPSDNDGSMTKNKDSLERMNTNISK
jgi:hypothetical protein